MTKARAALVARRNGLGVLALMLATQTACSNRDAEGSRDERVGSSSEEITKDCDGGADSSVYGIDVFDGQGVIKWNEAKAGTLADGGQGNPQTFAFIKATQGDYTTESTFATNWTNAKSAGILRSAYHFFDASKDGIAQANYFLSVVGSDFGELPAALDIECPTADTKGASQSTCEGFAGGYGFPADGGISALQSEAFDFLDTVEKATGRKPIIYSYVSWFASTDVTDPRLANYPLYISNIDTSCPDIPSPWTTVTFWQYQTIGGVAPGVSGDCDLDRWMGDLDSLKIFAFGAPDAGPSPDAGKQAVPDAGPILVDSGAPVDVNANAPPGDSGCGCDLIGSQQENVSAIFAFGALGAMLTRRRRRSPKIKSAR
jgi:lysozyme